MKNKRKNSGINAICNPSVTARGLTAGITLIALVITIVILLILAGISISALTDSGLFKNAKEAKRKSEESQELENETLQDYENALNKYLTGNGNENSGEKEVNPDSELEQLLKEANMTITLNDIMNAPAIIEELNGLIPVITENDVTKDDNSDVITYIHKNGSIIRTTSESQDTTKITHYAWKAFDNDINTKACSEAGGATGYYVEYEFVEPVYAMKISYYFANGSIRDGKRIFVIQGYNEENSEWEDLTGELTWQGTTSTVIGNMENLNYSKAYKRYRLYVKSATYTNSSYPNGSLYSGLYSMQLYGVNKDIKTEEEMKKVLLSNSNLREITLKHMVTNKEFTKRLVNALSMETVTNNEILMANMPDLIPVITENDVTKDDNSDVITYIHENGSIIRTTSEGQNTSKITHYAWKAFDNDINTMACSEAGSATGYYVEYEFVEPVYAMKISYYFANSSIRDGKRIFVIQGYNEENSEWEDLTGELTWQGTTSTVIENIENLDYSKPYKRYRLYVKSATYTNSSYPNGSLYSGLYSMQLYGKKK